MCHFVDDCVVVDVISAVGGKEVPEKSFHPFELNWPHTHGQFLPDLDEIPHDDSILDHWKICNEDFGWFCCLLLEKSGWRSSCAALEWIPITAIDERFLSHFSPFKWVFG